MKTNQIYNKQKHNRTVRNEIERTNRYCLQIIRRLHRVTWFGPKYDQHAGCMGSRAQLAQLGHDFDMVVCARCFNDLVTLPFPTDC